MFVKRGNLNVLRYFVCKYCIDNLPVVGTFFGRVGSFGRLIKEMAKTSTRSKTTAKVLKEFKDEPLSEEEESKPAVWAPKGWEIMFENMKKMRTEAPIDIMSGTLRDKDCKVDRDERFYILISLMLSSRTNDKITAEVMAKLRDLGFDLDYLLKVDENEFAQLIKPVNFYKTKAKHIKKAAIMLKEQFNGDVPKNLKDLITLPGVGMKMSLLALQEGWGVNEGLAVDTHVLRLSNLFNWIQKPVKDAEKCRKQLETWVPKELWPDFNKELVAFGQTICLVKTPKCDECLNNKICPAAFWHEKKKEKAAKSKKKNSPTKAKKKKTD